MTEWARIRKAQSRYRVSRDGEVKTLAYEYQQRTGSKMVVKKFPERVLKSRMQKHSARGLAHKTVSLQLRPGDGNSTSERVDIMVAEAFLGMPYDPSNAKERAAWHLMHIDGDLENCAVENLEWVHAVRTADGRGFHEAQAQYESNRRGWHKVRQNPAAAVARVFKEAA